MIPKIIHYCWFGKNSKPALAEKCMKSWRAKCPDYKIIEWNEDNFDLENAPLYVRQAYELKKWAFVSDYVRLQVIYEHGGVYLDTDVELKKSLNRLLKYDAYFGFEDGVHVNTGLGFGAVAGNPLLKEILDDYCHITFVKEDGSLDLLPCPIRNTRIFLRHGLKQDNSLQIINGNILILPRIYLCPIDLNNKVHRLSLKTISIHWFSGSWYDGEKKEEYDRFISRIVNNKRPTYFIIQIIGEDKYQKIKKFLLLKF